MKYVHRTVVGLIGPTRQSTRVTAGWSRAFVAMVSAAVMLLSAPPRATAQIAPDSTDVALVHVVKAFLETAAEGTQQWPGYDASSRPLVLYRIGRWSVYLNPPLPNPVDGWTRYPESWPALPRPAWLRPGDSSELVGQLAFDHEVPGATVVAIPLYEDLPEEYGNPELYLFAFIAHEAFHQYQRHEFADVETSSEELYPMLDSINNALAGVELRALLEAGVLLTDADSGQLREPTRLALAVHNYRWERLNPTARAIERGKEVVEGTAQYIEARMVAGLAANCRSGVRAYGHLCKAIVGLDASRWVANDLERRVRKGALEPTDMARNRIYSMAATVGLLLDIYDPGWKLAVTRDGTSQGLFERLGMLVADAQDARFALVERARERYGWESLLSASGSLIREYVRTFNDKLSAFNADPGVRVVFRVPAANTIRSRASREIRWVVDAGSRILGRYVEYVLRSRDEPPLELRIRNAQVLDESDIEGYRTITFFASDSIALTANTRRVSTDVAADFDVGAISFETSNASLRAALPGMVSIRPGEVRITLRHR